MGLTPVPDGHLAAIVTSLEMRERPLPKPIETSPFTLLHWKKFECAKYRALFARVGTPWLWFSRLLLSDAELSAVVAHHDVEVFAVVDRTGLEVGMLELDFREARQCEIAFFGLIPELAGKRLGRWLMAETLARAWRSDIDRVWVHTCTLDHPSALSFYRAQGFTAFRRQVEIFADPRLTGALPADAAPQIPVLTRR